MVQLYQESTYELPNKSVYLNQYFDDEVVLGVVKGFSFHPDFLV